MKKRSSQQSASDTVILYPIVVFLTFNTDPQPLSVSNELRPVDLAAGDHREIGFNAGPDCPTRVPVLPKLQAKVLV